MTRSPIGRLKPSPSEGVRWVSDPGAEITWRREAMVSKKFTGAMAGVLIALSSAAYADGVQGRWDASVTINGTVIPFRLDVEGEGAKLRGVLYNGSDKQFTTSAKLENGTLVLDLKHYLTTIVAAEKNGGLEGKVQMRNDRTPEGSPFTA